jgi:acetyltransferase-like isoleucine patch superfamily enzyme
MNTDRGEQAGAAAVRRALHRLREISVIRTAGLGWRLRCTRVLVYPRVHLGIETGSSIDAAGFLHLGRRWRQCAFLPSQFNMFRGARLTSAGEFSVYTGFSIYVNEGAHLELGSGYANNGLNLSCFAHISIGEDAAIAENVTIRDSDDHVLSGSRQPVTAPVVVGNHVWIGMHATILKGVTIGDGAVVAAGAIVTRDVPPAALVAGVPARVIRRDVEWK